MSVKIVWVGPDRLIPPYGSATSGKEIDVPSNIADSFVKQKLAKFKGGTSKVAERKISSAVDTEDN